MADGGQCSARPAAWPATSCAAQPGVLSQAEIRDLIKHQLELSEEQKKQARRPPFPSHAFVSARAHVTSGARMSLPETNGAGCVRTIFYPTTVACRPVRCITLEARPSGRCEARA